ncbi:hypothetical protein LguiB_002067 [Lonicera macranthoides]
MVYSSSVQVVSRILEENCISWTYLSSVQSKQRIMRLFNELHFSKIGADA